MHKSSIIKNFSLALLLGMSISAILLVFPVTESFIEHSKFYNLVFGALIVLFLFTIKTMKEKALRISVSPVSGAIFLFGIATAASTFLASDYPVKGLMGLGGIFLSTSFIALFGGNIIPKGVATKFLHVITGSSVLLVILTFLQEFGFGPAQLINRLTNSSLPTTAAFNIAGSPFIALQIVGITLLTVLVHVTSQKKLSKFFAITIPVLVIGAGLFAWNLLPGKESTLLLPSYRASWSVALDTIRAPKAAIIGAGVSSYQNAYQIFKPLWTNATANWTVVFSQAANLPLTLITTMGVLGLLSWSLILIKSLQFHKIVLNESKAISFFVLLSLLINLFLPFNSVMLTLQAVAIACLIANEKHRLPLLQMQALKFKMLNKPETLSIRKKSQPVLLYTGTILVMIMIILTGYLTARSLYAHIIITKSSQAIINNDAIKAYNLQQKAVALNPYFDVFRRRYSSTSALIAIALSNKEDITEKEKQQVSELLQQSIREARAAVTLDKSDSQNWSNLAHIYSNLIGVSEDAVNWTAQSYVSAIETNPTNPLLRLDLAAVFVGQKSYQQALNFYNQAINLKTDLPVSHFRRGEALALIKTPEALREARTSFQRALTLLPSNSDDYNVVSNSILELEKYMKENNISLEPETEKQTNLGNDGQNESEIETPSITEQNVNNTNTINSETEPVELNEVITDNTATDEALNN